MALPTAASPDCVALIITWDRLGTETFAGRPCVGGEPLTGDGKNTEGGLRAALYYQFYAASLRRSATARATN